MPKPTNHSPLVKCTRCRNKHHESERVDSRPDRYGMTTSCCPRCGGQSYYKQEGGK